MEKCLNCRWWERNKIYKIKSEGTINKCIFEDLKRTITSPHKILDVQEIPSNFGKCNNPKIIYTQAGGFIEDDDIKHNDQPDALLYTDGEAYEAYLMTGEAFGCTHFASRSNPQQGKESNG